MKTNLIEKAKKFALDLHKDQKYGDLPYSFHLKSCNLEFKTMICVLNPDFTKQELIDLECALWLHDSIEDYPDKVNKKLLIVEFNERIAQIVWNMTGIGKNRRMRNKNLYDKLEGETFATLLKFIDRTANWRYSLANKNKSHIKMYRKEYPEFKKKLNIYKTYQPIYHYIKILNNLFNQSGT